jgi:prophage tail gpP-like protein
MLSDKISLIVNDIKYDGFSSYEMDASLYQSAKDFTIEIPGTPHVPEGVLAQLYISGSLEFKGIIDSVKEDISKSEEKTTVAGRDLMGLLCDHYVEDFGVKFSTAGKTVREVTEHLIKDVPFVKRSDIIYAWAADRADHTYKHGHISPGQTVFDALKELAAGRGILFYSMPNGTFVLGKPREKGAAEFFLTRRKKDTASNNIISGGVKRDISRAWSKSTMVGQIQTETPLGSVSGIPISIPNTVNVKGSATMPGFPYYKPHVAKHNRDEIAPALAAREFINVCRSRMFTLEYEVDGHSQNGKPWTVNTIAHVVDECCHNSDGTTIDGNYLTYGRTFILNKEDGPKTRLKFGYLGMAFDD